MQLWPSRAAAPRTVPGTHRHEIASHRCTGSLMHGAGRPPPPCSRPTEAESGRHQCFTGVISQTSRVPARQSPVLNGKCAHYPRRDAIQSIRLGVVTGRHIQIQNCTGLGQVICQGIWLECLTVVLSRGRHREGDLRRDKPPDLPNFSLPSGGLATNKHCTSGGLSGEQRGQSPPLAKSCGGITIISPPHLPSVFQKLFSKQKKYKFISFPKQSAQNPRRNMNLGVGGLGHPCSFAPSRQNQIHRHYTAHYRVQSAGGASFSHVRQATEKFHAVTSSRIIRRQRSVHAAVS